MIFFFFENKKKDILFQVVEEIKSSFLLSLQLDESTNVSSCAQLVVYPKQRTSTMRILWTTFNDM